MDNCYIEMNGFIRRCKLPDCLPNESEPCWRRRPSKVTPKLTTRSTRGTRRAWKAASRRDR
jgi:hypothetical protein